MRDRTGCDPLPMRQAAQVRGKRIDSRKEELEAGMIRAAGNGRAGGTGCLACASDTAATMSMMRARLRRS